MVIIAFLFMKTLRIHTYKGEKVRNDKEIKSSNSIVYSELNTFETQLYSGHYGIKLPLEGSENYVINGKKFHVKEGHYLLTNPGLKTEVSVNSNKLVKGICIGFTEDFLKSLYTNMNSDFKSALELKEDSSDFMLVSHNYAIKNSLLSCFLGTLKSKLTTNHLTQDYNEELFFLDLGEILINDQLELRSKINNLNQSKFSTQEEIYRRIDLMNQYIHDNYNNNISLEELAKIACLSKYHAVRCYQKIEGISPYKKIINLRLSKAENLLLKGYSINEISDSCGFADYRAFSKLFKKVYHTTPSQYRQIIEQ